MTTTVLIIRHGETDSNAQGSEGRHMGWSNVELSAAGFAQAEKAASRLSKVPLSAIYSSSSRRAMSTAEAIGRPHGLKPVSTSDLREINYGDWEGQKRGEMRQKYPEIARLLQTDPTDVVIPGGETFNQLAERAIRAFNTAVAEHEGQTIALVSHAVPIRVLIIHALGAPYSIWGRVGVGNTAISTVQVSDGIPRLVTMNDQAHLER